MSKYFTDEEMACHCCGQLPEGGMSENLMALLDDMRERIGKPLIINCGYRCPKHNREEGGVPNSQHIFGEAADIDASIHGVNTLATIAEELDADGVGRYYNSQFVHVDVRSGRVGDDYRWSD